MFRSITKVMILAVTTIGVLVGSLAPVSAAVEATRADTVRVDARPAIDDVEALRLRCGARLNDDGLPANLCAWSRSTADDAAYTTLERNGGDGWRVLRRFDNAKRHRFLDTRVEPGARYRYRVRVYNEDGELVARSRSKAVITKHAAVDIMRLRCRAGVDDSGHKVAGCKWSEVEGARGYQLWRSINRDARELVGTYGSDTLAARDTNIGEDAAVVRYVVMALDADGDVIARSRVNKARFGQA